MQRGRWVVSIRTQTLLCHLSALDLLADILRVVSPGAKWLLGVRAGGSGESSFPTRAASWVFS